MKNFKNLDEIFEDNFISNETFNTGSPEDGGFDFQLLIEVIDLKSACGEKGYEIYVNAAKRPEYLTEEQRKSVMDNACIDPDKLSTFDVNNYGLHAPFDSFHASSRKKVAEILYQIDEKIPAYGGMCGFYFDRVCNQIGNTGWNFINGEIGLKSVTG